MARCKTFDRRGADTGLLDREINEFLCDPRVDVISVVAGGAEVNYRITIFYRLVDPKSLGSEEALDRIRQLENQIREWQSRAREIPHGAGAIDHRDYDEAFQLVREIGDSEIVKE